MMEVSRILTAACLFLFCVPSFGAEVTCFYTNWAQYRSGAARFTVSNINATLCTKLNYAFAKLVGNNIEGYEWNDLDMWRQFNNLKLTNPRLKTFLSVGGATLGRAPFSAMVSSSDNRKAFISSAISTLRTWNFDGLDIDWEFPVSADKQNLKLLTQEIFSAFETEGKDTNRSRLLLSFCVPAGINTINDGYDITGMISYLDFLNVMAYDYHGSWEYTTNLNSPLNDPGDRLSVSTTVDYYLSLGAPAFKLILGLAFYGRTWAVTGSPTEIGSPANGPGPAGEFTKTSGFLAYYEVCSFIRTSGLVPKYQNTYGYVNYGAKNGVWVTFEDATSIEEKVKYIQRKSLGGAVIWTIDFDDFSGQFCGQDTYPLTRVVSNLLMQERVITTTSTLSTTPANTTTTSQTATTTTATSQTATTTTTATSQTATTTTVTSQTATTTTTATSQNSTSTTATSTTQSTVTSPATSVCSSKFGFFPDNSDCSYYFVCENGIVTRRIKCNLGTIFNPTNKKCENLANTTYICPNQTSTTASTTVSSNATTNVSTPVSTTASTTTPTTTVSTTRPTTTASTTTPTTTASTTTPTITASTTTPTTTTTASTTTPTTTTTASTTTPTTTTAASTTTPTTTTTASTTTPTNTTTASTTIPITTAPITTPTTTTTASTTIPTTTAPITTPTTQSTVTSPATSVCSSKFGFFPDSSDCSYYFVCENGIVTRRIKCNLGTIFNPTNKKCENLANTTYICPNQTSTTASTTVSSTVTTNVSTPVSTTASTTTPTTTASTITPTTAASTTIPTTTAPTTTPTTTASTTTPTSTASTSTPTSTASTSTPTGITPKSPTFGPNACDFTCTKETGIFEGSDCSYFNICFYWRVVCVYCPSEHIYNPMSKKCERISAGTYTCPN